MADGFNRFNSGGQYFYGNQHNSHARSQLQPQHHRTGSPINNNGRLYQPNAADTPSPTNRSPGPGANSPAAHNPYSMYNTQNHRNNHGLLNGAGAHQTFQPHMNIGKNFTSQAHGGHQGHHINSQHNDHSALGSHTNHFGNHHSTLSASTLSNATPNFTPAHLNGTPDNASIPKQMTEHWALQLQEYQRMKTADNKTHFYARTAPAVGRFPTQTNGNDTNQQNGEEHGERPRVIDESDDMGSWSAMDMCGQGIKALAPILFRRYPKLKKMYLAWNSLRAIPPQIGQMRFLTALDLSFNALTYLPAEIGMLTSLKKLILYDNHLDDLPFELGYLYRLEMLGIEGNPMRPDYKERLMEHGTQELVRYLREQAPVPDPPSDRAWIPLIDEQSDSTDSFNLLSWNILCDRAATAQMYGYTATEALSWQRRRTMILEELRGRTPDIMCLQEMDLENYNEFFRPNLALDDYRGVFWPKSRAQTMQDREARVVDGSAIFFKNSKYILLDKQLIVFSQEAIKRPDMKGEHDVYNRVMPKDHVAVIAFLENRATGSRLIVANTHLTWEPWHSDIKIVQVAIMMEALAKQAEIYAKWPPCKDKEVFKFANEDGVDDPDQSPPTPGPSLKYDESTHIPLLVCGDFNSTRDSGVLDLITQGSLSNSHSELSERNYGDLTRHGMSHPFTLKSAYSHIGELPYTNYTPDFRQTIDWVFYSTNSIQVSKVLGEPDQEYMRRVPGFPNHYFPSDHLPLMMELQIKERKERKQVETDFGSSRKASRDN